MESWTLSVNNCLLIGMLETASARSKIEMAESLVHQALKLSRPLEIAGPPARDIRTVPIGELRDKPKTSSKEGQARLLHDIANIELQAMELAYRSLLEFPDAPLEFREQLGALVLSEAQHLKLCLDGIEDLGFQWGQWPGHLALWTSVSAEDSLLERILIVHRYLEGSGLDAGHRIQAKLSGFESGQIKPILEQIVREELDHVKFGSYWFDRLCREEKLDRHQVFSEGLKSLIHRIPKRLEKIHVPLRERAGFSTYEIEFLQGLQGEILGAQA